MPRGHSVCISKRASRKRGLENYYPNRSLVGGFNVKSNPESYTFVNENMEKTQQEESENRKTKRIRK